MLNHFIEILRNIAQASAEQKAEKYYQNVKIVIKLFGGKVRVNALFVQGNAAQNIKRKVK